jgi:hypothetical protein
MSAPFGRVSISLTGDERAALKTLAHQRSEPQATTAARFVRAGLAADGAALDRPPAGRRGPATPQPARPDAAADRAAAVALTDRYPHDLGHLHHDTEDRLANERLTALGRWRDQLDVAGTPDPRLELAFHAELTSVARWLEERSRRRR